MRKNAHLVAGESRWLPVSIALVAAMLVPSAAQASPTALGAESVVPCTVASSSTAWNRPDVSRIILGGAPSALDRIRETQQDGPIAAPASRRMPVPVTAGLGNFPVRMTLEPASRAPIALTPPGAGNCSSEGLFPNGNPPSIFDNAPDSGGAYDPDAELGTRAIPVKRTRFDDRWDRVRRAAPAGLMQTQLRRANATSSLSERELLARVNQWVNQQIAYVNDDRNYRQSDFWATAEQTIARGSGDCEDYAILKMQLLRAAGVDASRMKLVLLRDLAANSDHAFLLVQTAEGKVVLDNMTDRVYDGSHHNSVRPVLSFSENRRWVHAYRGLQPSPNLASLPASGKGVALALND